MDKTYTIFDVEGCHYVYDRFSNEFLSIPNDIVNEMTTSSSIRKYFEDFADDRRILCDFEMPDFSFSKKIDIKDKLAKKLKNELNQVCFISTENCNLRCKYCIYSESYKNTRQHNTFNPMSVEIAKKYIDEYLFASNKNALKTISFYGGEALLEIKKIMEIVNYAKSKSMNVQFAMNTNLTLLTDSILSFLVDNNFLLTISLDGPKEIHDKFRTTQNSKPTFDIVFNNLKRIREYNEEFFVKNIIINTVIVPHEYEFDCVDKFFSLPLFNGISLDSFNPVFLNSDENDFFEKNNVENFTRKFYEYSRNKFVEAHRNCMKDFSNMRITYNLFCKSLKKIHYRFMNRLDEYSFYWPDSACIPGMRSVFVTPNGNFFPCETLYDQQEFCLGNIHDGFDIDGIAKKMEDYVNLSNQVCKHCWAYRFCSHCYSSSYKNDALDKKKMLRQCDGIKQDIIDSFKLYLTIYNNNPNSLNYLDGEEMEVLYPNMVAD